MPHPLIDQFRFTRREWLRGLDGVSEEDAAQHFGPMNCIICGRYRNRSALPARTITKRGRHLVGS